MCVEIEKLPEDLVEDKEEEEEDVVVAAEELEFESDDSFNGIVNVLVS
jgi:hypothetical protein